MISRYENPVVLYQTRGDFVECQHRGAYVLLREERVIASAGEIERLYFCRSGTKFFQALPPLLSGAVDRYGVTADELALMCASHNGEPEHVRVAASLLEKGGLAVSDLGCAPHSPMSAAAASALRSRGEKPTSLHNNCSGKHAGMLLAARALGEPTADYLAPSHAVQRGIVQVLAQFAEIPAEAVRTAVDGCSAPTFVLPLIATARAFVNFGRPGPKISDAQRGACARLLAAIRAHPHLLAGEKRFCTALLVATEGRVLVKVGAEGFYGGCIPDEGIGFALHIDDGSTPASERLLAALLDRQGLLTTEELDRLRGMVDPERRNHAGRLVGAWVPTIA